MKSLSKTLLAVMAVAIMLGCALVPLTAYDSSTEATSVDNTVREKGFSIQNLLNGISELSNNSLIDIDGFNFIPADVAFDSVTPISEINSEMPIAKGNAVKFDNTNITFTGEGQLILKSGASFELLQYEQSTSYTVIDNKNSTFGTTDDLVIMEPGSYIGLFGLHLMFIGKVGSTEKVQYNLLSMTCTNPEGSPENALKLNVDFKSDASDNFTLTVDVSGDNDVTIFDAKHMFTRNNKTTGYDNDFKMTGKLTKTNYDYNVTGTVKSEIRDDKDHCVKSDLEIDKLTLGLLFNGNTIKINTKIETTIQSNVVTVTIKEWPFIEETERIEKATLTTGNISFDLRSSKSGSITGISISNAQIGDIIIHIGLLRIQTHLIADQYYELSDVDLNININNPSAEISYDDEGNVQSNAHMDVGLSISVKKLNTTDNKRTKNIWSNDIVLNISTIYLDIKNNEITALTDEISIYLVINGQLLNCMKTTVNAKISGFERHEYQNYSTNRFDLDVKTTHLIDGIDKPLNLYVKNCYVKESDTTSLTADEFSFTGELGKEYLCNLVSLLGIDANWQKLNPQHISIMGTNVILKSDVLQAQSLSMIFGNVMEYETICINIEDNIKCNVAEFPNVLELECGKISGYYKETIYESQKFNITDNPRIILTANESDVQKYGRMIFDLNIIEGRANFECGRLFMSITVDKDAKFSAKNLTAANFTFKKGSDFSGKVTLDSKIGNGYVTYGDSFKLELKIVEEGIIPSNMKQYSLTLDLDSMNSGELNAHPGFILPSSYSNDSGFSMKSEDHETGTFKLTSSAGGISDFECKRISYVVSYENDFAPSTTCEYGKNIVLTDKIPTKAGCTFMGWTDGGGYSVNNAIWSPNNPENNWIMPARDVVLTPIFCKTVTANIISENGKKIAIVDADECNMVKIEKITEDFDSLRLYINGIKIEMNYFAYMVSHERMSKEGFYITAFKMDHINSETVASTTAPDNLYNISYYNYQSYDNRYIKTGTNGEDGLTSISYTMNVRTDSPAKGFEVYSVDPKYGHRTSLPDVEFEQCEDGSYNVTFTTNMNSTDRPLYSIEPIYYEHNNGIALTGLIILILVVCAFFFLIIMNKRRDGIWS